MPALAQTATAEAPSPLRLKVGGTIIPGEELYIVRSADEDLYRWLGQGEYCNVLTPRQMGKSSLMMQTAVRLSSDGVRVATPDASQLGSPADLATWYQAFLEDVVGDLRIPVQVRAWWESSHLPTPNQRFSAFLREEVLARLNGLVVIFVDEIDSTLKLPYLDDFFVTIRAMYNQRSKQRAYRRLSFCLVGVATPNELIKDKRTTPYNIGRDVELMDFSPEQDDLSPLYAAVADDPDEGKSVVETIVQWTGGHPYLTLRLSLAYIQDRRRSPAQVDGLVEENYSDLNAVRSDPHFQQITRYLEERLEDKVETFSLYLRILQGQGVPDERTIVHTQLKLSGIVKRDRKNLLLVRNRIYERLFTAEWAIENLPPEYRNLYRRQRVSPVYDHEDIRKISERLAVLYDLRDAMIIADEDTHRLEAEIMDARRQLRKGPQLQPGEFLLDGRYRLIEPLGRGGFATVWKAYDRTLRRLVAAKVLHGQHSEDRSRRERFFRGSRKMAELVHPHIVRVFETQLDDGGWLFFVMELVPGRDFGRAVLDDKLSVDEKLRIIYTMGEALEFAHQRGIIHRDVKPSNILLDRNLQPKLTDFDLILSEDSTGFTQTRGMLGTLNYAAPETLGTPKDAGPPADIYSLASTAVFALSGGSLPRGYYRHPETAIATLACPAALKDVLIRAIAFDPEDRHSSAREFCDDLAIVLELISRTEPSRTEGWFEKLDF